MGLGKSPELGPPMLEMKLPPTLMSASTRFAESKASVGYEPQHVRSERCCPYRVAAQRTDQIARCAGLELRDSASVDGCPATSSKLPSGTQSPAPAVAVTGPAAARPRCSAAQSLGGAMPGCTWAQPTVTLAGEVVTVDTSCTWVIATGRRASDASTADRNFSPIRNDGPWGHIRAVLRANFPVSTRPAVAGMGTAGHRLYQLRRSSLPLRHHSLDGTDSICRNSCQHKRRSHSGHTYRNSNHFRTGLVAMAPGTDALHPAVRNIDRYPAPWRHHRGRGHGGHPASSHTAVG